MKRAQREIETTQPLKEALSNIYRKTSEVQKDLEKEKGNTFEDDQAEQKPSKRTKKLKRKT